VAVRQTLGIGGKGGVKLGTQGTAGKKRTAVFGGLRTLLGQEKLEQIVSLTETRLQAGRIRVAKKNPSRMPPNVATCAPCQWLEGAEQPRMATSKRVGDKEL